MLALYWELTVPFAREIVRFFSTPITLLACVSLILFLCQVIFGLVTWRWTEEND